MEELHKVIIKLHIFPDSLPKSLATTFTKNNPLEIIHNKTIATILVIAQIIIEQNPQIIKGNFITLEQSL